MIISKAAISDGKGSFTIEKICVSEDVQEDEVLVEIKACGVCHTDFDALKWGKSIIGHEGAGVVLKKGSKVHKVNEGDRVVLNWAVPCGQCFHCIRGEFIVCESTQKSGHKGNTQFNDTNVGRMFNIGTMANHTIVKAAAVTKINVDIPFASACLIGCGVMTGFGAVVNVAKVKPGENIAVIGVGGVGLNVIQGARILNAGKIIAVDINQKNLDLAKRFGATDLILAKKEDKDLSEAIALVKSATEGRGADYTFECSGVPALSIIPPLKMVRSRGQAFLLSNIEHEISVNFLAFTKDRSYMRPTYGWCHPEIDFKNILHLYNKGQYFLDEMVTATYALDDLQIAFDDMFKGKNARGVVVF